MQKETKTREAEKGATKRRLINIDDVLDMVPVARSTLYRMEQSGQFPKSVYISDNRRVWFEDEVFDWLKKLPDNPRRPSPRQERINKPKKRP